MSFLTIQPDSLLAALVSIFDVRIIYQSINNLAPYIAVGVTPVMVTLAIIIRTYETQYESLVTRGKWLIALRDMVMWTVIMGLYFFLYNLSIDFFNAATGGLQEFGTLSSIVGVVSNFIQAAGKLVDYTGNNGGLNVLTAPVTFAAYIAYYFTLIGVTCLYLFLRAGMAMLVGFSFLVGLMVLPLSMTKHLSLLKPWALLTAGVLMWPVVELLFNAILFMMINDTVHDLAMKVNDPAQVGNLVRAEVYTVFGMLNILIGVILIAAPFAAYALVSGGNVMAPVLTMFTMGGLASAKLISNAFQKTMEHGAKPLGVGGKGFAGAAKSAAASVASRLFTRGGTGPRPGGGPQQAAAPPPGAGPSNNTSAPASTPSGGTVGGHAGQSSQSSASGGGSTAPFKRQHSARGNRGKPLVRNPTVAAEKKQYTDYKQDQSGKSRAGPNEANDDKSARDTARKRKRAQAVHDFWRNKNANKKRTDKNAGTKTP
jgi:hypothetical protein